MRRHGSSVEAGGMNTPHPGVYRIDPDRSVVSFRTRHLFGLGAVRGTLRVRDGEVRIAEPVQASAVRATVDAGSFDTGNIERDRTVRSARLLDAGQYPVLTFASGWLTEAGGRWALRGSLTVAGNTGPVELVIEQAATADTEMTATARADIDRYAFGVTAMKGLAARRLSCRIEIVATRRGDNGHRG
jgi:polyisoprenoid-binding protein YceI